MLKDTGYQEKFQMVGRWLTEIIDAVKKDLKNEHLKIDREFCKRYFLGKNPSHVSVQEMAEAYRLDIEKGNLGLGEFIASRWLLKHTDLYGFFEERLRSINPEFEEINELNESFSKDLMRESVKKFGAAKTYLFCILNSVVFPTAVYSELLSMAENESDQMQSISQENESKETIEALRKRHEREMAALTDRYEKKLSGFQKKYIRDIDAMKKQISLLQKKLTEAPS